MATWAAQNNDYTRRSGKAVQSLQAISLIDMDELSRTKNPRGQQKLILASVGKLNNTTSMTGSYTYTQPGPAQPRGHDWDLLIIS